MKIERSIQVRLNDTDKEDGAWLLANYPNEFEAICAAERALATKQGGALFAFVIQTVKVTK